MALYSLLKLVALCALVHEAAAFAPVPPSACKEGNLCGQQVKEWHVYDEASYGDTSTPGITLTVHPLGGFDGGFIEAAKRMAEIKGDNIIVVSDGRATAWLKNVPNPEVGFIVGVKGRQVLAYY